MNKKYLHQLGKSLCYNKNGGLRWGESLLKYCFNETKLQTEKYIKDRPIFATSGLEIISKFFLNLNTSWLQEMSKRRRQGYLAKSERNSLFPKGSNHRRTFCTILQAVSPSYLGRKCCVLLASTKPIPTFPLDGRSSVNTFSVIWSQSITLFAHNTLNYYPYLRKSGKLQLSVRARTCIHPTKQGHQLCWRLARCPSDAAGIWYEQ